MWMTGSFLILMGWVVAVIVSVTMSYDMAGKRKRDKEGWSLLAGLLGPLAPLALWALGTAEHTTRKQKRRDQYIATGISMSLLVGLVLLMAIPFLRACFRI